MKHFISAIIIFLSIISLNAQPWKSSNDSADYYLTIGQYAKAEPFYLTSKKLIEDGPGKQSAEYANSCNNLGWLCRLTGKYQDAENYLIEARNLRLKLFGKDNADYATSVNRLAVLYGDVGMYAEAKPLYEEAMQIREKVLGKDHVDYAMSCNNMGVFYILIGNPAEAEKYHLEAKRIREKVLGKQNIFYAASCNNLGVLYKDLGQLRKSEDYYVEAKQIRGEVMGKQHPEYAASCDNLAALYMETGRFELAEPLFYEGKNIREKILGKSHANYAFSLNNLGLLYRNLGQYEKAKTFLLEATDVLGKSLGQTHNEYAKSLNNLGALYMDMGNYDEAEQLYNDARNIWIIVVGKEHTEYAKSCNNLALMYYFKGQLAKAAELFAETNSIREKILGKDNPDYAASSDNLAVVYTEMGEYEKALPYHTAALTIRRKLLGVEHADFLQSCINNANLYWNMGDMKKAGELYKEAFHSQQLQVDKVFRFTTEPEKLSFLKKINDFKNYFYSYTLAKQSITEPGFAYDVALANRNLTLSSSAQLRESIHMSKDTALQRVYKDWIDVREQLAFLYARSLALRKGKLEPLEEKANMLEKELTKFSEVFRNSSQYSNWKEIQASLKPGEATVEFASYKYYNGKRWTDSTYYIAVVLRKDKPAPEVISLFEQRELDAILNYKTTSPGQLRLNYIYSDHGNKDLYDLVWKPLEKSITGIKTVFFTPTASLYKVSFAALPLGTNEVLSDRYQLVQLNSTASILKKKTDNLAVNDKITLYGGIQYDADSVNLKKAALKHANYDVVSRAVPENLLRDAPGEFYFLSGTEKEISGIVQLASENKFRTDVAKGIEATEESFKSLSGNQSPVVLHIATHGFFFADPKNEKKDELKSGAVVFRQSDNPLIRSGLAFAGANNTWKGNSVHGIEDGILTSFEVSNMYFPGTRLAVLSACETGLGEIQGSEGVYGFQRAFKIAGVENLVMSLWKVPDEETSLFMQAFYNNIFHKKSITDSFYDAQNMMKNKFRNEPFKWAAWVLVK